MFRTNYDFAYLDKDAKSGVIILKLSGSPSDRIDDVNIVIDNQNNCQINYTDKNWRMNRNYIFMGEYESSVSKDKVHPHYIETIEVIKNKWFFSGKKVQEQRVKEGLIQLNKPEIQHTIRASNWFIEFNERAAIQNTIQNTIL